jgi:hypothetical protein
VHRSHRCEHGFVRGPGDDREQVEVAARGCEVAEHERPVHEQPEQVRPQGVHEAGPEVVEHKHHGEVGGTCGAHGESHPTNTATRHTLAA